MKEVPVNSHFKFNALLSMATSRKSRPEIFEAWGYVDTYTYFLVNEQFDRTSFEAKIPILSPEETVTTDTITS